MPTSFSLDPNLLAGPIGGLIVLCFIVYQFSGNRWFTADYVDTIRKEALDRLNEMRTDRDAMKADRDRMSALLDKSLDATTLIGKGLEERNRIQQEMWSAKTSSGPTS